MVQFISGPKGSGKTKKIIDLANSKVDSTPGEVVFINDKEKYREKLDISIRYVNADEFYIFSTSILFGFLNGLIAENYDIDTIYIDNVLRITKVEGIEDLDEFLKGLNLLEKKHNIHFVLSITTEVELEAYA